MACLILKAATDQNIHNIILKNEDGNLFSSDCEWMINENCGAKVGHSLSTQILGWMVGIVIKPCYYNLLNNIRGVFTRGGGGGRRGALAPPLTPILPPSPWD